MLTAAEYFENLQAATLQDRLTEARTVSDERLDLDVEHGALTETQRSQVLERRAELLAAECADEDVA